MSDDAAAGDETPSVRRVVALVELQSSVHQGRAEAAPSGEQRAGVVFLNPERSTHLNLHVSLSAEDTSGRRIRTAGRDFGMSGPRVGVWHRWHGPPLRHDREKARRIALEEHHVDLADIEDGINQLLGRDPRLHRPPRLSWENLTRALADAGVPVSEESLIAAPLTIELAPEVQSALDNPGP